MNKPDYLFQGDVARLFPVLATSSKEGRATSVLLACTSNVQGFARAILATIDQNLPKRATLSTYTEVVLKGDKEQKRDRPDGLIAFSHGKKQWRALIETKVGNTELEADQVERYRTLAKDHKIDCVITISNQFCRSPKEHPLEEARKSRSRIPVFHWSWMFILTTAELLLNDPDAQDEENLFLLSELKRFLSHESTGVKGYTRMPSQWADLNRHISAGGTVNLKSEMAIATLDAWYQEIRDLTLILSRQTEVFVTQKIPRKLSKDFDARLKNDLLKLKDECRLSTCLEIPDAASPIEIYADIMRRTVEVGMSLKAPEDKVTTKARTNWLLRQIKTEKTDNLHIRLNWPGRSSPTQYSFNDLNADVSISEMGKEGLQVASFYVFETVQLGARFTQQANFITDLERIVPSFYHNIGENLKEWRKSAPKIKDEKSAARDVSLSAIAMQSIEGSN